MNNTLQLLTSKMFGTVRCDFYHDGNNVFMTSAQLGEALNYSNPQKAIDKLIERNPRLTSTEFSVTVKLTSADGKSYNTRVFTEDGIYEVAMLSRTDKAEAFRDFVRTVLKSVNRFGAYMTPDVLQQTIQDPDFLIGLLTRLKEYQAELTVARPKVAYFDALVDRNMLTNFRDTAKELGLKQNVFLRWLADHKFIYKDAKGAIKPYAEYTPDLFVIKEVTNLNNPNSWAGTQTLITPKGRETFRLLLGGDLISEGELLSEIENSSSVMRNFISE